MKWDYRILAFTQPDTSVLFTVREITYNEDNQPSDHTDFAPLLIANTRKGLCLKIKAIKKASEKPVLWGDQEKLFKVYKKLKKKNEIIP
jgi:hypothetical protein